MYVNNKAELILKGNWEGSSNVTVSVFFVLFIICDVVILDLLSKNQEKTFPQPNYHIIKKFKKKIFFIYYI